MNSFTAIIRKGDEQFVALCQELDVVSQGYTIEEFTANLKEAVELYLEEIGIPEQYSKDTFVVKFGVNSLGKTPKIEKNFLNFYNL